MKLKITLLAALAGFSLNLSAQLPQSRTCGKTPTSEWHSWFNNKVEEYNEKKQISKGVAAAHVIPVVVHVIHGGQNAGSFPNISQAQINSQLAVLNADFAGTGLNSNNIPSVFAGVKANTNISFCLAMLDPNGSPLTEAGIHRVNYNTINGASNPASISSMSTFMANFDGIIKPATIWDPTRYFNIWVSDAHNALGILGYATFPTSSGLGGIPSGGTANDDGIWVGSRFFGTVGSATYPYNRGRTATHEVGHWLGLVHIDGDSNCGNDYCNDTPVQKTLNFGCPSHPLNVGICAGNTTGEMFMNFMDYCDDACLSMFTNAQTARMQTAMSNCPFRNQLTISSATMCNLQPSPANSEFIVQGEACVDSTVVLANYSTGTPGPTYSWSANPSTGVTFLPGAAAVNPTLTFMYPGTYAINLYAANSQGYTSTVNYVLVQDCGNINGIGQMSFDSQVRLSPNPTTGEIKITVSTANTSDLKVIVTNYLGQPVQYETFKQGDEEMKMDLKELANGIYFVTVNHGSAKSVKRIVLNK